MTTGSDKGDGSKRKDFTGGWPGDSRSAFTVQGRTPAENDMFNYLRTLLQWRKTNTTTHSGQLKHFIPSDGIYTYFRYNAKQTVMVVMNNNEETKTIETKRYNEFLKKYKSGKEIISGSNLDDLSKLTIAGKSVLIVELK
jgi:glycosidase